MRLGCTIQEHIHLLHPEDDEGWYQSANTVQEHEHLLHPEDNEGWYQAANT